MSIRLTDLILHQLDKNDASAPTINVRSQRLESTEQSAQLITAIHQMFDSKMSKNYGVFKEESEVNQWIRDYLAKNSPFETFCQKSGDKLLEEMNKYPFSESGILVFAHYTYLTTEYLFIGVIPLNQSLKVTDELGISATDFLDINKMDITSRLNLSLYQSSPDSNQYLSFMRGRVGRKISDFFMDFLQTDMGLDIKAQNQKLSQAIEGYSCETQLDKSDAIELKRQALAYCTEKAKSNEAIDLKEFSEHLTEQALSNSAPESKIDFMTYSQDNGYELDDSFPADTSVLRKLTKYVGGGGGLSISFDSLLLGERIFYDKDTDTLTIKGTPPNLKHQLLKDE